MGQVGYTDWASDERKFRQRVLQVMILGATGIGLVSIGIDVVALVVDDNWYLAGSGLAWTVEIALMAWLWGRSKAGQEVEAARGFIASGTVLIGIVALLDTPSGVLIHQAIGSPFLILSALALLPRDEHNRWKYGIVAAYPAALLLRQAWRPMDMFLDVGEFLGAVVGGAVGIFAMATLGQVLFDRLDQARRDALAAHLVKTRFLAVMSHELRTPLNGVIGYAELLREELEDGEMPRLEDVDRIADLGRRLLAMVGDILDFTTLEEKEIRLSIEDVDVAELGSWLAGHGRILAEDNGNRFVAEIDASVGRVATDRGRLERVLLALVGNACKFTDAGEVRLQVDGSTDEVRFTVVDTGEGMEPEALGELFQPFTQGDSSFTRTRGGIGVGLAIVDRYRKALGAHLDIDTAPDAGTRITVTLPRAAAAA